MVAQAQVVLNPITEYIIYWVSNIGKEMLYYVNYQTQILSNKCFNLRNNWLFPKLCSSTIINNEPVSGSGC